MLPSTKVVAEYLLYLLLARFDYEMGSPYRISIDQLSKITGYHLLTDYPVEYVKSLDNELKQLGLEISHITYGHQFIDESTSHPNIVVQKIAQRWLSRRLSNRLLNKVVENLERGITRPMDVTIKSDWACGKFHLSDDMNERLINDDQLEPE